MRQWTGSTLVQIMACRLFGTKPLSKPMLGYCQLDPRNKLQWISKQNTNFFIHENASENIICETLSRGRWVKLYFICCPNEPSCFKGQTAENTYKEKLIDSISLGNDSKQTGNLPLPRPEMEITDGLCVITYSTLSPTNTDQVTFHLLIICLWTLLIMLQNVW